MIQIKSQIFLIFVLIASAQAFVEENGVLVLGQQDFELARSEYEYLLIKFYAPWCGHCKNLAPIFDEAAGILKDGESSARLAKVDCTIHINICSKLSVRGYPTVLFFKKGIQQPEKYTGQRTKQSIVQWIVERTGEKIEALIVQQKQDKVQDADEGQSKDQQNVEKTIEEQDQDFNVVNNVMILGDQDFERAKQSNEHILVKFFAPWCGHCKSMGPAYIEAAGQLIKSSSTARLAQVDCTVHSKTCQNNQVRGYPTLLLFSKGKQQPIKFTASRTAEGILGWLGEQTGQKVQKQQMEEL